MAGLVFGKLFFPNETPLAATLNAFAIYFVGFVARPIGAFIFGHFGDRVGRKSMLIVTLMLMGTRRLYAFADRNKLIHIRSPRYTQCARTAAATACGASDCG